MVRLNRKIYIQSVENEEIVGDAGTVGEQVSNFIDDMITVIIAEIESNDKSKGDVLNIDLIMGFQNAIDPQVGIEIEIVDAD